MKISFYFQYRWIQMDYNSIFLLFYVAMISPQLSGWLSGKEFACQVRRLEFDPWVGKIP